MKIKAVPFEHFLNYEDLTLLLEKFAQDYPDLIKLSFIGNSREGRRIHLITVTDFSSGKADDKPAYLIHANIHALELSGTQAALFTLQQLIADHKKNGLLEKIAFYIVPRLNPDGAEFAVTTSGTIRSRIDRNTKLPNTLYQEDVNSDGLILAMRQEHPHGNLVIDPEDDRLLINRSYDSPPPYFRTFPEGMINDWDGSDNIRVEGRAFDWNRNWSYDWRPEPEQGGAGDYPFSEKEMKALADFVFSKTNIFGVLGYHNGPAALLRPPSSGSDNDLNASDVKFMKELSLLSEKFTGLPTYPVIKYHSEGSSDNNLKGHFHNFGYHHLGLYVFEYELGTIYNSAGFSTKEILSSQLQTQHDRIAQARLLLKWWDKQKKKDPLFKNWERFNHPQLGKVEIGGLLRKHLFNPTLPDLKKLSKGTYKFTIQHAAYHPSVTITPSVTEINDNVYRIRALVCNTGKLPTNVTAKGKNLKRLKPVSIEFKPAKGVELLSLNGHQNIGHLNGVTGHKDLEWFVKTEKKSIKNLCEIRSYAGTGGNSSVTVKL